MFKDGQQMKIKLSTIIRLCALILVILFFVPTSIASCSSYGTRVSVEISPFELAAGKLKMESNSADVVEEYAENLDDVEAQPIVFIMLALSVIILALGSKLPILGAFISIVNAVSMYVMHFKIAEYVSDEYDDMVNLIKTNAYYAYIIIAVIIAVLLLLKQFNVYGKLKNSSDTKSQEE